MKKINSQKYKMSPNEMGQIVGGKKVLRGIFYIYKSCATDEDPECRTLDYTIKRYAVVDIFGNDTGKIVDKND